MDCRGCVLAGLLAAAWPAPAEEALLERVPLKTAVPEYPDAALRDRVEGEVQVCFEVDRRGRPWRIAVRSSTHRIFERPSIRAVRASSYPRNERVICPKFMWAAYISASSRIARWNIWVASMMFSLRTYTRPQVL